MKVILAFTRILTRQTKTLVFTSFCIFTLLFVSLNVHAETFHLFHSDRLMPREKYQLDVLKLVLDNTQKQFGDYKIQTKESGLTIARRVKIAEQSPEILLWISPLNEINTNVEVIKYPIFNGLLGLRSIVVDKDNLHDLNQISNTQQLREYTVGQGPGWAEVKIYRHNGFNLVEARLSQLFNMLAKKRFDILPLGKLEISQQSLNQQEGAEQLIIAPKHMIYYPHPVLFHLNQKHELAIQRLTQGLKQVSEDGSLEALFTKHFSHVIAELKQRDMKVFALENNTLANKYRAQIKNASWFKTAQ